MAGEAQERTEAATLKRKYDARRKGTVVRSTDLVNACCVVGMLLVLPIATSSLGAGAIASFRGSFLNVPTQLSVGTMLGFSMNAAKPMAPGLLMIIAVCMGIGLAVNFGQVGFVLSPQALAPNFKKLNPITGLGKFLSRNSAFETGKGLGKAFLFSLIAVGCITASWQQLNALNQVPINEASVIVGQILRTLGLRVAIAWAALAGCDYYFQRQQVDRQLKMTKDEVKREMREMETSPEVKAGRNMRRRRLMRKKLSEAVKEADVIVTNPTHYAVALKYEMGKSYAPMVVAKGVDYLAAKIRHEAALAEIPLVPNAPLARALYKQCEVGDYVPRELFQAVAEVLAYVYKTIKRVPR